MSSPPDWRDSKAYEALRKVDRSALAWEWLRRDSGYCQSFRLNSQQYSAEAAAELVRWGLHAWVAPSLGAGKARPVWRAERHPHVLRACAGASAVDADSFDLACLAPLATLIVDGQSSHLLLNDGRHSLRLDVEGHSLTAGPVRLHYVLGGFASLSPPLATLLMLRKLLKTGEISEAAEISPFRRARSILVLRAWDGLQAGATRRDVAAVLLRPEAADARWRTESPSLRSQVQRLARDARAMAHGAYWRLLGS